MEANPFDPWVNAMDGRIRVPHGPGLGVEPDATILKKYQIGEAVRMS